MIWRGNNKALADAERASARRLAGALPCGAAGRQGDRGAEGTGGGGGGGASQLFVHCWNPDCRARKRAPFGRRLTVRDGRRAEGMVATSRVHYLSVTEYKRISVHDVTVWAPLRGLPHGRGSGGSLSQWLLIHSRSISFTYLELLLCAVANGVRF